MKSLIVCTSVSHGNTKKIADAMAGALGCHVVTPAEAGDLSGYDLVGFGSGIYNLAFHEDLVALIDGQPAGQTGRAFVFATSGLPEPPFNRYAKKLAQKLEGKGFEIAGTFLCRGYDTWAPFKVVGGIRKNRPDLDDLEHARTFAAGLTA